MRVIVCGGTSFIGYQVCRLLREQGHHVSSIALDDIPLGPWWHDLNVETQFGDLFGMSPENLVTTFQGYDAMVYALGPDDRVTPKAPAYEYFHDRLVIACSKIVQAAKDAGVKKVAICNSYFAYFDRIMPELNLAENHPYIKCRVEQAEHCIEVGNSTMDVMILELPYIFGTMPEREPLWKEIFVERIKKMKGFIWFFKGGTVMMSVERVAESIVGAIEQGKRGKHYPCGDECVSWDDWLKWIMEAMDVKRKIIHMPGFLGTLYGSLLRRKDKKEGKEGGLNHKKLFKDIQTRMLCYDPTPTCEELGVSRGGLKEAVIETIKRCLN